MKFFDFPAAFVAAIMLAIFAFGVGLTSPIWLILDGKNPVEAMQAGTPVVTMAIVGLIVTVLLGVVAQRLRKPSEPPVEICRRRGFVDQPQGCRRPCGDDADVHRPLPDDHPGSVLNQMVDFR